MPSNVKYIIGSQYTAAWETSTNWGEERIRFTYENRNYEMTEGGSFDLRDRAWTTIPEFNQLQVFLRRERCTRFEELSGSSQQAVLAAREASIMPVILLRSDVEELVQLGNQFMAPEPRDPTLANRIMSTVREFFNTNS